MVLCPFFGRSVPNVAMLGCLAGGEFVSADYTSRQGVGGCEKAACMLVCNRMSVPGADYGIRSGLAETVLRARLCYFGGISRFFSLFALRQGRLSIRLYLKLSNAGRKVFCRTSVRRHVC